MSLENAAKADTSVESAGNCELVAVREVFSESLGMGERGLTLTGESELLGALPELDSMAVVSVITALEEHYGFYVEDDEISGETFETLGALVEFVEAKLAE